MRTNGSALSEFTQIISENREVAESYVALLGALRLSCPSGNSILVTSTEPGDGKTTVAACLVMTASLAGQSALFVDGDLRRPSLASSLDVAPTVGLTDILLGDAEAGEAIDTLPALPASVQGGFFRVVTGGRKPATVLTAVDWSAARQKFRLIAQSFDITIIDSSPMLVTNDALLLAKMVDGVLLVVGAGTSNLDELKRGKQLLDTIGAPVIGTVLNKSDPKFHGPFPHRHYPYNGRSHL